MTVLNSPVFELIGVSEEEQKKKGIENIFEEIIVENFLNMGKEIVNQVQEAQSLTQDKPRRKMLRHILIKLTYQTRRLKAQSIKHNIKSIKGR